MAKGIPNWSSATGNIERVILQLDPSHFGRPSRYYPRTPVFLLYINDLPNRISSSIKLFACDCKVHRDIKHRSDCNKLQHHLNKLSAWSKDWLLDFSVEKYSVLRIRKKLAFAYCINGQQLNETSDQKDLGVLVSNDLNLRNT